MAEESLDGSHVVAVLDQVGGEGVAESVASDLTLDPGSPAGFPHRALEGAFVQVMPASGA